jgi:hypothetical protein
MKRPGQGAEERRGSQKKGREERKKEKKKRKRKKQKNVKIFRPRATIRPCHVAYLEETNQAVHGQVKQALPKCCVF